MGAERVVATTGLLDGGGDRADLVRRTRNLDSALTTSLQVVVDALAQQTAMRQWTVNRRSDDTYVVLAASPAHAGLLAGDRLPWSTTICGLMVDGRGPAVAGTLLGTVYEPARTATVQAYMGVALRDEMGRVIGTIAGTDTRERDDLTAFTGMARLFAQQVGHLLALHALRDDYERALHVASRDSEVDPLTGIGNRRAWDQALPLEQQRMDLHGTQAGVIVIDVDHLKHINDAHGHSAGDQALCCVAEAITAAIRIPHLAARTGGDEFAVLVGDVSAAELNSIVVALTHELHDRSTAASIGSATTYHGDLSIAFDKADQAMYRSKRLGGQSYVSGSKTREMQHNSHVSERNITAMADDNSGPAEGAKGIVEGIKGKAKEAAGAVTGNDSLNEEGQAQQDKADAQRDAAAKEAEAEKARGEAKANEARQKAAE